MEIERRCLVCGVFARHFALLNESRSLVLAWLEAISHDGRVSSGHECLLSHLQCSFCQPVRL